MKAQKIPFSKTNSFSKLILDYLEAKDELKPFYRKYPSKENLIEQAGKRQFDDKMRKLLIDRLKSQYEEASISIEKDQGLSLQIQKLSQKNSFTITTGHQLCLMGGPLYFLYKIISVIKLSRELNAAEKKFNFLPVFWMASEDHDVDEIDHFYHLEKKYHWKTAGSGPVGRLNTGGLEEMYHELKQSLPEYSGHANDLLKIFEDAYLHSESYAVASRKFIHRLFGSEGLLIIDGDDAELKRSFAPIMKRELESQIVGKTVGGQSDQLSDTYKIQVNPRDINLFYLDDSGTSNSSSRDRIERIDDGYQLVESNKKFTGDELLKELETHPEKFSPNVLMRPIYQEVVLPNLAYIGGGGELAYWFQLLSTFEEMNIDFPYLILRNSAIYLQEKELKLLDQLKLQAAALFEQEGKLVKDWVIDQDNEDLQLLAEKAEFESLWNALKKKSLNEDPALGPFVEAEESRLKNWLNKLSDKLIRSQRRKQKWQVKKISQLKANLFPNGSLQERKESLINPYMNKGNKLIPELIDLFEVPTDQFLIIELQQKKGE